MDVHIEKTVEKYFRNTESITREAFWNLYKPGCDEHLILHNLRKSKSYVSELDLVAVAEDEVIGHVISTKAKIIDPKNLEHEVLCVGPVCVLPDYQKKGIGSKLMNQSIRRARELGFPGMILFGDPEYYHRFGFRNALDYGISTKEGQNFEPFMVLELQPNGLQNIHGRFFEDDVFTTQPDELDEFEKQFPYKEKLVTDTQFKH